MQNLEIELIKTFISSVENTEAFIEETQCASIFSTLDYINTPYNDMFVFLPDDMCFFDLSSTVANIKSEIEKNNISDYKNIKTDTYLILSLIKFFLNAVKETEFKNKNIDFNIDANDINSPYSEFLNFLPDGASFKQIICLVEKHELYCSEYFNSLEAQF